MCYASLNVHRYCHIELMIVQRIVFISSVFFFFQAEDGIRDLVRSRGLGDVYKRQGIMK